MVRKLRTKCAKIAPQARTSPKWRPIMKNKFELLPPSDLAHHLLVRKQQLEQLLAAKTKALATAPEGRLRISKSNGAVQYYQITEGHKRPVYICKKNLQLARALAQKQYNKKIAKRIRAQVVQINKLLQVLEGSALNVECTYNKERQQLIELVTLSDKEYASRWLATKYEGKPFVQDVPAMFSSRGERVRSKSEVIIADTLARFGVPYRYEWPLQLADIKVHPDFYCLNLRTREEIAWEHFGMIDNSDYAEKMVYKLKKYEKSNFQVGRNLIISMETTNHPITIKDIEQNIRGYLV